MNGANEFVLSDAALIFDAAQGIDKVLFTDGQQQMRKRQYAEAVQTLTRARQADNEDD